MPTLAFVTTLPRSVGEVRAQFETRERFEALLPRYLARIRVTYPQPDGLLVGEGTLVEFRPWLFPERWRVRSHLAVVSEEALVWRWREGPLRGTETWFFEASEGGCRFTRRIDYLKEGVWERVFWRLVAIPVHTLVAALERRRLTRWARRGAPEARR